MMKKELNQVNMVRQQKKAYLPIELLGSKGRQLTKAFEYIEEKSIIKQKFLFTNVPKLRGESIKRWKLFLDWMK